MVKLNATILRYLTNDDFRALTAVELGTRNHEWVPVQLINQIARLKYGGCKKCIANLHKFKLLAHRRKKYDGYRLTYPGYDFLAIKTLCMRNVLSHLGNQLGTGKESDVYLVRDDANRELVLKLHRLGRVSFRTVKDNRDYLNGRKCGNWLYLSRLAALKEFALMKVLYANGFDVPEPISVNRHAIVMSRVPGHLLANISAIAHPRKVYKQMMDILVRLAAYGLVHGDFNEFNILVDNNEKVYLIDFPQMLSTTHEKAKFYFERDCASVRTYFKRKFGIDYGPGITLEEIERTVDLDEEVEVHGFTKKVKKEFDNLVQTQNEALGTEEDDLEVLEANEAPEDEKEGSTDSGDAESVEKSEEKEEQKEPTKEYEDRLASEMEAAMSLGGSSVAGEETEEDEEDEEDYDDRAKRLIRTKNRVRREAHRKNRKKLRIRSEFKAKQKADVRKQTRDAMDDRFW